MRSHCKAIHTNKILPTFGYKPMFFNTVRRIAVDCRELSTGLFLLQSNIQYMTRTRKVILLKLKKSSTINTSPERSIL